MANDRLPLKVRRLLRRHPGDSGVIFYGRFNWLRGYLSAPGWSSIALRIEGALVGVIVQTDSGPIWHLVSPGEHILEFVGDGTIALRREMVLTREGEVVIIAVTPVERWPFHHPNQPVWEIRTIRKPQIN